MQPITYLARQPHPNEIKATLPPVGMVLYENEQFLPVSWQVNNHLHCNLAPELSTEQLMARSWLEGNLLAQFTQNLPDTTGIVNNKHEGRAALNNHSNNVLKLYPNPASSQALTIHIDASVINDADLGNLNLGFYNAVGKLVKVQGIAKNATQMVMPINQLPNGIYTCVLSTNNQTIAVQKLTIIR
ncbi:MAG: T9SS type A sorting domain-containing protein [Sphingobacteriales bacterium]|nr:T9SS type A sorting domain-containing protein [Sphingobacteriales bacterium]MBK6888549.1 T9SS type A sorting domain-containing protein [Sphingobacteriales bacterium]MBK7528942.1 T9SS type A sorting domain-containing protein [Sphingobacteriales bacterium]MBL0247056.1 T9SS type A sorting domain-containing protein [Sphingobacteriales bacterium]